MIKSGRHLAVVRSWIQNNARNGDSVTWGSQEILKLRTISVREMELLAQRIADAAIEDYEARQNAYRALKQLRFVDPSEDPHYDDVSRIVEVGRLHGCEVSREDAKKAWETHSNSAAAEWLRLPEHDQDLWWNIQYYLRGE